MHPIDDIKVFLTVVETSNMTRAGNKLGLSAAVVSKRIINLEKRLGVRLLNRSTRQMTPTVEGQVYYDRCRVSIDEIENTELALTGLQTEAAGLLKVSIPASFGRKHISPRVAKFLTLYPKIDLQLQLTDQVVDIIGQGIDVAIRIGNLPDSNLIAKKLAPNKRILCASPAYLKEFGNPDHPSDLRDHSCLILGQLGTHQQTWQFKNTKNETINVRVTGRLVSNNGEALRDAVLGGLGIAKKSTWDIGEDVNNGLLISLLDEFYIDQTDIFAVYPHRLHISPKVRAWIDFLKLEFSKQEHW